MKPRLLVVDNQLPIRFAYSRFFSARGWQVDACSTAPEALRCLEENAYRAVVADLRLDAGGDLAGLRVVEAAAARPYLPRVVVVTAYGAPEMAERVRRLGAHLFLEKPVRLRPLADWLELEGGPAAEGESPGPRTGLRNGGPAA